MLRRASGDDRLGEAPLVGHALRRGRLRVEARLVGRQPGLELVVVNLVPSPVSVSMTAGAARLTVSSH